MPISPTFVAQFADGEITRLTTYTSLDKLDVARGLRLARHAYSSRTGKKKPPAVVAARFERNGATLKEYAAKELKDVAP